MKKAVIIFVIALCIGGYFIPIANCQNYDQSSNGSNSSNVKYEYLNETTLNDICSGKISAPPGWTVNYTIVKPGDKIPDFDPLFSKFKSGGGQDTWTTQKAGTGSLISLSSTSGIAGGYSRFGEWDIWHLKTESGTLSGLMSLPDYSTIPEYPVLHQWGNGNNGYLPENDIVLTRSGSTAAFAIYAKAWEHDHGTAYVGYLYGSIYHTYRLTISPNVEGGNVVSGWYYDSVTYTIQDLSTQHVDCWGVELQHTEYIFSGDFALEESYPPYTPNNCWITMTDYTAQDANGNYINLAQNYYFHQNICSYWNNLHSESYSTYNGVANAKASLSLSEHT